MPTDLFNPPPITLGDLRPHAAMPGIAPIRLPTKLGFWGDLVPSVFRRETSGGSFIQAVSRDVLDEPDPSFDPRKLLGLEAGVTPQKLADARGMTVGAARAILASRSFGEFLSLNATIAKEHRDAFVEEQFGFWSNLAAGLVTGLADPVSYIPIGGQAVKGFQVAKQGLRSGIVAFAKQVPRHFVEGAKVGAIATALSEVSLQATQLDRHTEESLVNIGAGAVFAGGLRTLGAGVGAALSARAFKEDVALGGVQKHKITDLSSSDIVGPGPDPKASKEAANNAIARMMADDALMSAEAKSALDEAAAARKIMDEEGPLLDPIARKLVGGSHMAPIMTDVVNVYRNSGEAAGEAALRSRDWGVELPESWYSEVHKKIVALLPETDPTPSRSVSPDLAAVASGKESTQRDSIKKEVLSDIASGEPSKYLYHTSGVIEPITKGGLKAGGVSGTPMIEAGYGEVVHVFRKDDIPNPGDGGDVSLIAGYKPAKPIATFTYRELGIDPDDLPIGARGMEIGAEAEPPSARTPQEEAVARGIEAKHQAEIASAYGLSGGDNTQSASGKARGSDDPEGFAERNYDPAEAAERLIADQEKRERGESEPERMMAALEKAEASTPEEKLAWAKARFEKTRDPLLFRYINEAGEAPGKATVPSREDIKKMTPAYRNQATGEVFVSDGPGEGHVRFAERLGLKAENLNRNSGIEDKSWKGPWSIDGHDYGMADSAGKFYSMPELDGVMRSRTAGPLAVETDSVLKSKLHPGMEFLISGYGYRVKPDGTIVPDGRVPKGGVETPLSFEDAAIRIDKGSLDLTSRREYSAKADADISNSRNYELLGSGGVGIAIARLVSPIAKMAQSASLVARDALNKLMTVSAHIAAQVAGISGEAPVQVRAEVLRNKWATTYAAANDIRLGLKDKLDEAAFGKLVSHYLIDKNLVTEGTVGKDVFAAVSQAADIIRKDFLDHFGLEAKKVFKDFEFEPGYFPRHAVRELVDSEGFIDDIAADIWASWQKTGQAGKKSMDDARNIAFHIQNQWLSQVTDGGSMRDAIVSSDFYTKWTKNLREAGIEDEAIAAIIKDVQKAEAAVNTEKGFASRADLGERINDAMLASAKARGIDTSKIQSMSMQMLDDIYSNRTGFVADELAFRAFTRERSVELSPAMIAKYTDTNLKRVMLRYARQAAGDIEITRTFGDPLMQGAMMEIRADFQKQIDDAVVKGHTGIAAKLQKEMDWTIDRLSKFRDDVRGVLNVPSDPNHWYGRGLSLFRGAAYLVQSGGFLLSNLADAYQAGVTVGMKKLFWNGWSKYVTDSTLRKLTQREARLAAEGMEGHTARMIVGLEDVEHGVGTVNAAELGVRKGAQIASWVNLMAPFQDLVQNVNFAAGQHWLLSGLADMADGKALNKGDQLWFSKLGVTSEVAKAILAERPHWIDRRGNLVANTKAWSNPSAAAAFRNVMHHAGKLNRVMAEIGDKPLFFSSNLGKSIGQFKAYAFGSASKIALMRLQQRDARVLTTTVAQLGVGLMAYGLKQWAVGKNPTDHPEQAIGHAIEYSGLTFYLGEADRIMRTMSGDAIGINPLGRSVEGKFFSPADAMEAVAGPSFGLASDLVGGLTGAASAVMGRGPMHPDAIHDLRQAIPFNNAMILKQIINKAEKAVGGR